MKREIRQKKSQCEFAGDVKKQKGYTMDCFYFGYVHQINGDCPILNGGIDENT